MNEIFGEPIYSYTDKEAVEDGFLVEIKDSNHISYFTTGVYEKCIEPFVLKDIITGHIIKGTSHKALIKKLVARIEATIYNQIKAGEAKDNDWFYSLETSGWKFFVAQNEAGKFTVMFPEEY